MIGGRVQLFARSPPEISIRPGVGTTREASIRNRHFDQRLPRLHESLAEPTHGAGLSRRSEVVFNSSRDLLPRSLIWVLEHRRYSHPSSLFPPLQLKNCA
ncbi:hypothetical protein Taro_037258 [Colocasia esculenta]|uniref:Uncharacterized protein n=1 Tax=Colocasia esculenta TaxID=4460 RepID=A0A843WAM5_COLES|nr:hypothetical protein [Colocasia esculenta]